MSTLLVDSLVVDLVFIVCVVTVCDFNTYADLINKDMLDFNMFLCMG